MSVEPTSDYFSKPDLFICYNEPMGNDQLNDLKQFIDSKISQTEQRIKDDIARVESKVEETDLKLETIPKPSIAISARKMLVLQG